MQQEMNQVHILQTLSLCANTAVVIEMTSVFFELTPIARPSNILCTDKGSNKMTDATELPCICSAICSF